MATTCKQQEEQAAQEQLYSWGDVHFNQQPSSVAQGSQVTSVRGLRTRRDKTDTVLTHESFLAHRLQLDGPHRLPALSQARCLHGRHTAHTHSVERGVRVNQITALHC